MFKYSFIFCFIACLNMSFAQSNNFRVEEIVVKGELNKSDPYDPSFGRFDGVELYLNKGDVITVSLIAEFPPFIALVAPSEEYFVEYSQDGSSINNYLQTIDESGTWFLSIAGDSSDFGAYELVANYVSANSITIPSDAGFCTSLNFISEHSKIDFFYLIKSPKGGDIELWEPKISLAKSISSSIANFEDKDGWYYSVMVETNSKDSAGIKYNELVETVKNCLGSKWVSITKDWRRDKKRKNELKKEHLFAVKEKSQTKLVSVIFIDKGKNDNKNFRYQISIELKRK